MLSAHTIFIMLTFQWISQINEISRPNLSNFSLRWPLCDRKLLLFRKLRILTFSSNKNFTFSSKSISSLSTNFVQQIRPRRPYVAIFELPTCHLFFQKILTTLLFILKLKLYTRFSRFPPNFSALILNF